MTWLRPPKVTNTGQIAPYATVTRLGDACCCTFIAAYSLSTADLLRLLWRGNAAQFSPEKLADAYTSMKIARPNARAMLSRFVVPRKQAPGTTAYSNTSLELLHRAIEECQKLV